MSEPIKYTITVSDASKIFTDSYVVASDLFTTSFKAHTCYICGAMVRETATILHQKWHETRGEI